MKLHIVFSFRVLQFHRGKRQQTNKKPKYMFQRHENKQKNSYWKFHPALMLCTLVLAEPSPLKSTQGHSGQRGLGVWSISQRPSPFGPVTLLDSTDSPGYLKTKGITAQWWVQIGIVLQKSFSWFYWHGLGISKSRYRWARYLDVSRHDGWWCWPF